MTHRALASLLALAAFVSTPGVARSQCPSWGSGFGSPGGGVGGYPVDASVHAQLVHDDGSGRALFVAGWFHHTSDVLASNIARWDGTRWSALGSGVDSQVNALAGFDDGSGPVLYAGGWFTTAGGAPANRIASWDGTNWSALGSGLENSGSSSFANATALVTFDDGTGPALYVGGQFSTAGGVPAQNIARWDGASWSAVGAGLGGDVYALAVFDDGGGPALYAGGGLVLAGGVSTNVAKWNGSAWSATGVFAGTVVMSLAAFDDGGGPALYAGFSFGTVSVAKWNGTNWTGLPGALGQVSALAVFDDGTVRRLHAGSSTGVAHWNGASWLPLAGGVSGSFVYSFAAFDEGAGPRLFVGGWFSGAFNGSNAYVPAGKLARWDGSAWSPVGPQNGIGGTIETLAVLSLRDGTALYAGGTFSLAGSTPANNIARWNGSSWSALGRGLGPLWPPDTHVYALAAFDDGGGPELYAGGRFSSAGGLAVQNVAKWDGANWHQVGTGLDGYVRAFAVFDDGTGPALYAGGFFSIGGGPVVQVARWDGTAWTAVGGGIGGQVFALCVHDDGAGPALHAANTFNGTTGGTASRIVKWVGTGWTALGSDFDSAANCLLVFDDGSGSALYVGGSFAHTGGASTEYVARWNGVLWSAVGNGTATPVVHLAAFDDGSGRKLVAATGAGYAAYTGVRLSKWDGSTWSSFGGSVLNAGHCYIGPGGSFCPPFVNAMATFDDGSEGGPDLYVGGLFVVAGDRAATCIAVWRGCGVGVGSTFCYGDGVAAACPCGNSGLPRRGCENSAATGGARLVASGGTSPDSIVLSASELVPNVLTIFLQGGTSAWPGSALGDGLSCLGNPVLRLYAKNAIGDSASAPTAGDPSITARAASLGDTIAPGSTRVYQVLYRDANAVFCPSPVGGTMNLSSGATIRW